MPDHSNTRVGWHIVGARRSRTSYEQWFRYLSKAIGNGPYALSPSESKALLESGELTTFQKVTLEHAMIKGTPTNRYVDSLNQRAKTTMVDEMLRRYGRIR